MRKTTIIAALFGLFIVLASNEACKKESNTIQEFIADNNSFATFPSWSLDKTFHGPDPLLGALAHANNDSTVIRDVYFKDGQNPVNGKYPVGTLIVKHSHNSAGTVNEHTAMAKRGNNFNSGHGDWEFFVLTPSGSIATDNTGQAMRGANLMNGMCQNCHSGASHDLVFSK